MTYTIKLRRGTAAEWTVENPVLASGEPGLESDTDKVKYGDGSTPWNSLEYPPGGEGGGGGEPGEHPNLAAHDSLGLATQTELNAVGASVVQRANHTGVQTSATISDFTEAVQDAVGALLGAGSNVTLNYNDAGNTLTIASSGGGTTDPEAVRDAIGVALIGAGLIGISVNDAGDTITISTSATQNSTDAALRDRGSHTGAQAIGTVTGLQAELDSKLEAADLTLLDSRVDAVEAALPGKAAATDVTALDTRVDVLEGFNGVLVLEAAEAVPGGTPAGTVIVRWT